MLHSLLSHEAHLEMVVLSYAQVCLMTTELTSILRVVLETASATSTTSIILSSITLYKQHMSDYLHG